MLRSIIIGTFVYSAGQISKASFSVDPQLYLKRGRFEEFQAADVSINETKCFRISFEAFSGNSFNELSWFQGIFTYLYSLLVIFNLETQLSTWKCHYNHGNIMLLFIEMTVYFDQGPSSFPTVYAPLSYSLSLLKWCLDVHDHISKLIMVFPSYVSKLC